MTTKYHVEFKVKSLDNKPTTITLFSKEKVFDLTNPGTIDMIKNSDVNTTTAKAASNILPQVSEPVSAPVSASNILPQVSEAVSAQVSEPGSDAVSAPVSKIKNLTDRIFFTRGRDMRSDNESIFFGHREDMRSDNEKKESDALYKVFDTKNLTRNAILKAFK